MTSFSFLFLFFFPVESCLDHIMSHAVKHGASSGVPNPVGVGRCTQKWVGHRVSHDGKIGRSQNGVTVVFLKGFENPWLLPLCIRRPLLVHQLRTYLENGARKPLTSLCKSILLHDGLLFGHLLNSLFFFKFCYLPDQTAVTANSLPF